MNPAKSSELNRFFEQHGIRDVECIFADVSGYPRGKLMPASAFAAGGGLGRLLIEGQKTSNYSEMFAGAVLVALLAIVLDVVLGGVGQLAGTVYAAIGLGLFNKFLEGISGAVLAKITVLVFIIIFIQKRPQGMFALKGRFADA